MKKKEMIFGYWKEYGWGKYAKSINETEISSSTKKKRNNKNIDYLERGIPILGLRTIVKCLFTGEDIGIPRVLTDGKYIWTTEYIYYIKKNMLIIDEAFENHMEQSNFLIPTKDSIDYERVEERLDSL